MSDIEKMLESLGKIHYDPDFDDFSKHGELIAPMPQLEEYKEKRKKLNESHSRETDDPYFKIDFNEPRLSPEQEIHLFRKMNFLKFLAKKHAKEGTSETAKLHYHKSLELRNFLVVANSKMVISCSDTNCHGEEITHIKSHVDLKIAMKDELCSYMLIAFIAIVEDFDWTIGYKFSTFAYKSLSNSRNNFFREFFREKKKESHVEIEDDQMAREYPSSVEASEYNKKIEDAVDCLLGTILDPIRIEIIQRYFGIRGYNEMTLAEMTEYLHVAKSGSKMTRQNASRIYNSGLEWMRVSLGLSDKPQYYQNIQHTKNTLPKDVEEVLYKKQKEYEDGDH